MEEFDANIMETQSKIFSSLALPAHGQQGLRPNSGIPEGSILPGTDIEQVHIRVGLNSECHSHELSKILCPLFGKQSKIFLNRPFRLNVLHITSQQNRRSNEYICRNGFGSWTEGLSH